MKRIFVILLFLFFTATSAYSIEIPQILRDKGYTPLVWAASKGDIDEVRSLIDSGADLTAKNSEGMTALDIAKFKRHKEIIKLLESAGETRSSDGRYIDHGDGAITDTNTGLMWTQKDSYADLGKCLAWKDSKNYVSRLNTGGHSDWRLPTINELMSIYEESKMLMAFDNESSTPLHLDPIFASGGAYWYWSSKTVGSCCARGGSFSYGVSGKYTRDSCFISGARAVRR